jgi:hypothetical protein
MRIHADLDPNPQPWAWYRMRYSKTGKWRATNLNRSVSERVMADRALDVEKNKKHTGTVEENMIKKRLPT